MSKTGQYIVENNIEVNPEVVDDSTSENEEDKYWNEQAERSAQEDTYRRMVELGKADI